MYNTRNKPTHWTVAGTLALYSLFGVLIFFEPRLLSPLADPQYPALSKMLMPVWRGASDFIYASTISFTIYFLYRMLSSMRWFGSRRIARKPPEPAQLRRETLLAANFALAAGIQGIAYIALAQFGLLKIYPTIAERGWVYAIASGALFLLLSDAWFYLCHRFYHRSRFVFRNVHAVHHLSVVTTPMTNSQISPWELLPSALFGITFVMVVPMAMPVLSCMVIFVNLYLILLHSGYEIFPRGTASHPIGKWLVTPTYHQLHHELFTAHMGLYFTWWDRMLGTYSEQYSVRFAEVTGQN